MLLSNLKPGKKIGEGYFGEVFDGHDDVHGLVAIKFLTRRPGETNLDWGSRKVNHLREAQNLKKANHPNVVEVFHLVESDSDDKILYVMEHCAGGCLKKTYEKGPIPTNQVRKIATDATLGLGALHGRGMIHRDIKPSNILQDSQGKSKLGDFGLVTDNLILGYGSAQGYSDHLAPEIWTGKGTSIKTDIWALGMTTYRLLHGHKWYSKSDRPSKSVKDGGFAQKLKWLPHIPKAWRTAVRSMLRDDPSDRCASAAAALKLLAGLPVERPWRCEVDTNDIRWERSAKTRRTLVVWTEHSPKKHEWRAWSEPIGHGRKHALGGSNGLVGRGKAIAELEEFFVAAG